MVAEKTWWKNLQPKLSYQFGMLQLDIVGHSAWSGNEGDKQRTKEHLKHFVTNIAQLYGGERLAWPGDGGQFLFLLEDLATDPVAVCALHLLRDMQVFNAFDGFWNQLGDPVVVRISAHRGSVLFNGDPETLHGDSLNFFLKHERELAKENSVSITEEVYGQIRSRALRSLLKRVDQPDLTGRTGKYVGDVYRTEETNFSSDIGSQLIHSITESPSVHMEGLAQDLLEAYELWEEDGEVSLDALRARAEEHLVRIENEDTSELQDPNAVQDDGTTEKGKGSNEIVMLLFKMTAAKSRSDRRDLVGRVFALLDTYKRLGLPFDSQRFRGKLTRVLQRGLVKK